MNDAHPCTPVPESGENERGEHPGDGEAKVSEQVDTQPGDTPGAQLLQEPCTHKSNRFRVAEPDSPFLRAIPA